MKTPFASFARILSAVAVAVVCLLALPGTSQAKDKDDHHHHKSHHSDDYWRKIYFSHPRSSFSVSFGDGWRGLGYYYGPPGASYYYEGPGISFYGERRVVPRTYTVVDESYRSRSVEVSVQRALAHRGYHPGPIDGVIGPMTRSAIARYQEENGLRVTGSINSSLLDSLDVG